MTKLSKSKSWRDVLPIHPAAELFPMMSDDELRVLGEDIRKNGLRDEITLLDGQLLDGRNRLEAMAMAGIKLMTGNGQLEWAILRYRNVKGVDPVSFVISTNIHRRHLTAEQKRDLIAKLLKATPEKPDRQIAEAVKADHKTVGKVRTELEGRGEIPHVETRTDTQGRKQQTSKPKPRPTKETVIADFNTAIEHVVANPAPKPADIPPRESTAEAEEFVQSLKQVVDGTRRLIEMVQDMGVTSDAISEACLAMMVATQRAATPDDRCRFLESIDAAFVKTDAGQPLRQDDPLAIGPTKPKEEVAANAPVASKDDDSIAIPGFLRRTKP